MCPVPPELPLTRAVPPLQDLKGSIRVFCRVRPRGRTGDSSNCMVEVGWQRRRLMKMRGHQT